MWISFKFELCQSSSDKDVFFERIYVQLEAVLLIIVIHQFVLINVVNLQCSAQILGFIFYEAISGEWLSIRHVFL